MRRLYAILLTVFVLAGILSDRASAQPYTMNQYLLRQSTGSGSTWTPLAAGTAVPGLSSSTSYYMISNAIQFPFTFRFLNTTYTSASSFLVNESGSIILSQSFMGQTYDWNSYYNPASGYDYSATYGPGSFSGESHSPNQFMNNESGGGYYPNYKAAAMEAGFNYQGVYGSSATVHQTWTYAVLGSAPNRQLVVETDNVCSYYNAAGFGNVALQADYQVVLSEGGISQFQFNYAPQRGNFYNSGSEIYGWSYSYKYLYSGYTYGYEYGCLTGIKEVGGNYMEVGWNSDHNVYNNGVQSTTAPLWGYNSPYAQYTLDLGGSRTAYVPNPTMNTPPYLSNCFQTLPTSSITLFIAWAADFSTDKCYMSLSPTGAPPTSTFYQPSTKYYPTVMITNQGTNIPTQLTLRFRSTMQGASTYVYTYDSVITAANLPGSFQSKLIVFNSPTSYPLGSSFTTGPAPGSWNVYNDTATIFGLSPTADQSPGNNMTHDQWICAPQHDIKAITVTSPAGSRTPISLGTIVQIEFQNIGSNTSPETNVALEAIIKDKSGFVYYDTQYVAVWAQGVDTVVTTFLDFTPQFTGIDSVWGIVLWTTDQLKADDTTKGTFVVAYNNDVAALSVFNPQQDEERPYYTTWKPGAYFRAVGASPGEFQVPARVEIRRCSDGQLVFRADSLIEALNVDNAQVPFFFPTVQGGWDISKIPPGCYNICAIAKLTTDGDRSNDTACGTFSIIDRLKGDIYVGVGQRFQTLHAAVDSLTFRGVGGNVRLLLADNNYTENGTYRVSNPNGALDFTQIRGLADTARLTILPRAGGAPHILFTGNRPFCFYFGDLRTSATTSAPFGGYVTIEGYNPQGVPAPDQLVAEPNKRTMTIVDSSTAAGGVFSIEAGSSNITLKDLRLIGNGMVKVDSVRVPSSNPAKSLCYGVSHDSDAVVRIYNEHNFQSFTQGVRDTVPINHIRIENCEIAGAKYGIYDHGFRDGFRLQSGPYKVWRNQFNTFTRNTIGTSANPIGYAGIQINHERDLTISHNEISNVNALVQPVAGYVNPYTASLPVTYRNVAGGIGTPDPRLYLPAVTGFWPGDTGNVERVWIDGNRIHNITGTTVLGVVINQSTVFPYTNYTPVGSFVASWDTLPKITQNRVTNNMIFDLRGSAAVLPVLFQTIGTSTLGIYSTDRDSIFSNSISTSNALCNIEILGSKHAFLWDNIIQNTDLSGAAYTNYLLQVPRPYAKAISSDYNLFDLRGNYNFATVSEYVVFGQNVSQTQSRTFRRMNDWRTYLQQDMHSLMGDPMFASDSLNLPMPQLQPPVLSPAASNGMWLGTAMQSRDFFGNLRMQGTNVPNIGASDQAGFQYNNDLAVLSINQPTGYSPNSDTTSITIENPLWINATVKNLSSQAVFNQAVTASVDVAISGGAWTNIYRTNSPSMSWDINQAINVVWRGPTITPVQARTGVFRVTVNVPSDQNNGNNTMTKYFRILLKNNAVLLSYNWNYNTDPAWLRASAGARNMDSLSRAMGRLGIPYDTLNRFTSGANDIDYTPYWTVIWAGGDPAAEPVSNGTIGAGTSNLSFKETQELERYLQQGQTYAKKSLIMAGQKIAYYLDYTALSLTGGTNLVIDTEFAHQYIHTRFLNGQLNIPVEGTGISPNGGVYNGWIQGQQAAYWNSRDSINASPDPNVVKPAMVTPLVGPVVNSFAYAYLTHPSTPADSGAGVTYYDPTINTVFFGFDWSNPWSNKEEGGLTAGTTRILKGALGFVASKSGTILPIEFSGLAAEHMNPTTGNVKWTAAEQSDVARFDVESNEAGVWTSVGTQPKMGEAAQQYSQLVTVDPAKTYTFRVAAVNRDGQKLYSGTVELGPVAPQAVELSPAYPNPTSADAEVQVTLPVASNVTLRILDVTGNVVKTAISDLAYGAGIQNIKLHLSDLASGSYIYELVTTDANGQTVTMSNKLTLSK